MQELWIGDFAGGKTFWEICDKIGVEFCVACIKHRSPMILDSDAVV